MRQSNEPKKNPYNFTVKFNARSPLETAAAMYLNDMKNKAPYLASLITKDLSQSGILDQYMSMARSMASVQTAKEDRSKTRHKMQQREENPVDTKPVQTEKPPEMLQTNSQTAPHTAAVRHENPCDVQEVQRAAGIMSTTYAGFFGDDDD